MSQRPTRDGLGANREEHPGADANRSVYERQAKRYDADRSRDLAEEGWLERFVSVLPEHGRVLDVGCGGGEPIAGWLIASGFRVTGVDFVAAMVELARSRWPDGDWRHADMRTLEFVERFDGIIAWDSFFHLTPDEQTACIPRLAHHLVPGGTLMLTVGPEAAEQTGAVGGELVYHSSLSPAGYASLLEESGLRLTAFLAEDPACRFHTVLIAQKNATRG